jgi:hypothetical protein
MARLQSPRQVTAKQVLTPLDEAIAHYEASSSFSCSSSLERLYGAYMLARTHYGDFTSKKKAVKCAPITVRWDGKDSTSKRTTFDLAPIYQNWEPTLKDLVQDCKPATFRFNSKDVFNKAVAKPAN